MQEMIATEAIIQITTILNHMRHEKKLECWELTKYRKHQEIGIW